MPDSISSYLRKLERALQRGDATEHTYRPALKCLIESVGEGVTATNEPKRVACGAPDFIVTRGRTPVGYIEAKDVGKSLDRIEKTDQFKRYVESLGNLILTDYLEFRWFVEGERRMTARLAKVGKDGKLKRDKEGTEQVERLLDEFLQVRAPVIGGPKELARRMAGLAQLIRDITGEALRGEEKGGMLHEQLDGFRKVLLHNLTAEQFADMYAQTISYGLFAARCNYSGKPPFTREHAPYDLPKTNPFLRRIFSEVAGLNLDDRIAWTVDDLAELLNRADIAAILRDFGKRTRQEDPVVHFYETFLAAYDPKMREARGVYYTPEPVVSYIVRSVDHILRTDFGLPDGLADTSKVRFSRVVEDPETGKPREVTEECHKVLILDPAVGTGTFLHGVIDQIYSHLVEQGQKGAWSSYVSEHLLPRLFGFELLMAPYAVAHMKLGIQLADLGYDFGSEERLGIYLTNTLEEAYEPVGGAMFARELVQEANAAVKVKLDWPILVVLGNPPYSGHSANTGEWITELLRGKDTRTKESTHDYFKVDGKPLGERNPKWLNDDYVKFIRFAQWRIERTGYGILAFISNHGYIDNPTFRGMRQSLMETFDDIYILDLHGSSKKKERCPDSSKDENVFDIQQGVAIAIFVKRKGRKKSVAAVRHADLWGLREAKYRQLWESDISCTKWAKLGPQSPFYLFVPYDTRLLAEYERGSKLTEAMPVSSLGVATARDELTVQWSREDLMAVVKRFASLPAEEAREQYGLGEDTQDWRVSSAQNDLADHKLARKHAISILYRPFDIRYTFYTGRSRGFMCRPRHEVMKHMLPEGSIGIITTRSIEIGRGWEHVLCSNGPIQLHTVSMKEVNYLFPLYLRSSLQNPNLYENNPSDAPGGRRPNLAPEFTKDFAGRLNMTFIPDGKGDLDKAFGPEDIFDYMYAVFHSPNYRSRYAEFLKRDFPRLPLTSKKNLFRELSALGGELVGLHLMEKHGPAMTSYPVEDDNIVEKVRYTEPGQGADEGRVWINKTQHFEGVPPEVWEFHIGGYQVCEKWLKDRKGRELTYDDISHYQSIVSALSETIRLMAEIDVTIDRHGGWPIV